MAGENVRHVGHSLLDLSHDIGQISGYGDVYKKDCTDLARRIALLSDLFEEIRDFKDSHLPLPSSASSSSSSSSSSSPSDSYSCLTDLLVALQEAKRLLLVASNSDSNTSLEIARKKISFQIQCVTWKLERTLENLPYDYLNISDEVREQVELVRSQLRRAAERNGPMNSKILSRTTSQPLEKEVDMLGMGNKVIGTLHIANIGNIDHEFQAMVDIVPNVTCKPVNMEQMVHQLEKPQNLFVVSEACKLGGTHVEKAGSLTNTSSEETTSSDGVVIPDEYRCPISLELMRDPVIVATGQTYERSYIQRWIDCGNKTCPKTQQKLSSSTLTPNYVLRSLIMQWCEKHKIENPMVSESGRIRKSDGSFLDVSGAKVAIEGLIHKLSSQSIEDQRSAAAEIRSLSKRSTENRILIAEAGAIPLLVNLLMTEDIRTQENVVTSILNLSIYENNKGLIMLAGAVPSIVQVLTKGSMEAKENAAAALFSLSVVNENKIIIGASGAIPPLVELLQNGSSRGKKDAATALYNLCIYQGNKGRAVRAGILAPLMTMLTDSSGCMVDESLTILSVLVSHQEGKVAMTNASVIPVLIDLIRTGLPRNKENAAAILLSLCKKNVENLAFIGRLGALIPLTELTKSGTKRAKCKATSLLEHLQKLQQL